MTEDLLSDNAIRNLPETVIGDQWCLACGSTRNLERAHVRNKGLGGRKKQGPRAVLCRVCHHERLHASPARYGLDIGESGALYWREDGLYREIGRVT